MILLKNHHLQHLCVHFGANNQPPHRSETPRAGRGAAKGPAQAHGGHPSGGGQSHQLWGSTGDAVATAWGRGGSNRWGEKKNNLFERSMENLEENHEKSTVYICGEKLVVLFVSDGFWLPQRLRKTTGFTDCLVQCDPCCWAGRLPHLTAWKLLNLGGRNKERDA